MSDLVENLRKVQLIRRDQTPLKTAVQLCQKAADRIEHLETKQVTLEKEIERLNMAIQRAVSIISEPHTMTCEPELLSQTRMLEVYTILKHVNE